MIWVQSLPKKGTDLFSAAAHAALWEQARAERKTYMESHADAFIIAPGGIGTYEEFFEVYTLKQLGRHSKAIVIFNPFGYYDDMMNMLRHTVSESFMQQESLDLVAEFKDADSLIDYLENYHATKTDVLKARYAFIKGEGEEK